eukprot:scaffold150571_cov35-Tisochrysis_lutea.AAC.4
MAVATARGCVKRAPWAVPSGELKSRGQRGGEESIEHTGHTGAAVCCAARVKRGRGPGGEGQKRRALGTGDGSVCTFRRRRRRLRRRCSRGSRAA